MLSGRPYTQTSTKATMQMIPDAIELRLTVIGIGTLPHEHYYINRELHILHTGCP
jgi:hypothetical protein